MWNEKENNYELENNLFAYVAETKKIRWDLGIKPQLHKKEKRKEYCVSWPHEFWYLENDMKANQTQWDWKKYAA